MGPYAAPGSHEREGEEREGTPRASDPRRDKPRPSLSVGHHRRWNVPERGATQRPGAGHKVPRRHSTGVPHGVYHSGMCVCVCVCVCSLVPRLDSTPVQFLPILAAFCFSD